MGGDAWRARNKRLRVVGVRGGAYVLLLVSVAGNNENEEVSMGASLCKVRFQQHLQQQLFSQ